MCKKLPQPDKSTIKLNHLQSDWYNDEQRPLVGCYEPEVDVTIDFQHHDNHEEQSGYCAENLAED